MASVGFNTLAGNTRVRTPQGLVRLDLLSGSGPQGPQGPTGPTGATGANGADGADGTVDTTQFYTKTQADILLAFKQHIISSTSGAGTEVWDSANNLVRRLVAGTGVTLSLDANGNIVVDSTGGGSGSIPSTIAEFTSSQIIHKVPTRCNLGLTVANTMVTDYLNTGTVRSKGFTGKAIAGDHRPSWTSVADTEASTYSSNSSTLVGSGDTHEPPADNTEDAETMARPPSNMPSYRVTPGLQELHQYKAQVSKTKQPPPKADPLGAPRQLPASFRGPPMRPTGHLIPRDTIEAIPRDLRERLAIAKRPLAVFTPGSTRGYTSAI